ncbi:Egl nine-like protein 1 [Armadillidium vulgare]|nr:Egl nine-like protein 1 [Armadillidium vulgare]
MNEDNYRQCAFCGISDLDLRLCGACKVVRYCSTDHQKQHWNTHKPICKKVRKVSENNDKCKRNEKSSKRSSVNSQGDALSLNQTLLDSVINNQSYSNGSVEQEPDLSTPIDSPMGVEDTTESSQAKRQSLYQLELTPDNHSLAEQLGPDWLSNVTSYVLRDLNQYGFCAVDNFLGNERALKVLSEVMKLHSLGVLSDGQVVSRQVQAKDTGMIRGDKITWVSGIEKGCETIRQLVTTIDSVIACANKHNEAGKLSNYNINFRTRAMVACYPGGGTRYVKHIDNPNKDGRCVTAIYYINKNWKPPDGGVLRIYAEDLGNRYAQIEPIFDRMLFFWSDRRNPHEVLPSVSTR